MSAVHHHLATLSPRSVLRIDDDNATSQLDRRFDLVVVTRCEPAELWTAMLRGIL